MTTKQPKRICNVCRSDMPRRAERVLRRRMIVFGVECDTVLRLYTCQQCGNRIGALDATAVSDHHWSDAERAAAASVEAAYRAEPPTSAPAAE